MSASFYHARLFNSFHEYQVTPGFSVKPGMSGSRVKGSVFHFFSSFFPSSLNPSLIPFYKGVPSSQSEMEILIPKSHSISRNRPLDMISG